MIISHDTFAEEIKACVTYIGTWAKKIKKSQR